MDENWSIIFSSPIFYFISTAYLIRLQEQQKPVTRGIYPPLLVGKASQPPNYALKRISLLVFATTWHISLELKEQMKVNTQRGSESEIRT